MYRSTTAARGVRRHPVSVASHRHKPEPCKNTPYLNSRHCHQVTDMKPTHRTLAQTSFPRMSFLVPPAKATLAECFLVGWM